MPRALELAASQPWLMLPDALDNLLTIADRMGDPGALESKTGIRLENSRTVSVRNGVAIIPVVGPVFRYANLFTEISGATSTQVLATDLQSALDDPSIKSIILNIDSPGGVAAGINELADQIHAGRARKRIVAYVGGTGASAAYWLASAASEIVIDETALLGSIGVVVEAVVEGEASSGRKRYQIVSRNAPNKRLDMATEEGRAKVGETVDAMGEVFVAKVARNLGVASDAVPAMGDFGGLRVGAAAVESGLAHRLGSLEGLITELAKPAATQPRTFTMTTVNSTAQLREALAAGTDPNTIEIASASQPELETARTQASAQAVTAERERIKGINGLASKGFETEITAAIDSGASVEATALQLFKAAQDRGISLSAIKADSTRASTSTPTDGNAQGERKAVVGAIVAGASRR
ncbi:S49 family peptidase [Pseudomonas sp. ST1]|uniref:Phage-related protein n=1 Tax=Pseudomonas savastanoi pv. nerii TaxID=360921 RepID=A0A3M5NAB0_PSESS|nr:MULTISPECIES: S49 family peptidase [Pseudomonas]KAA3543519.1 S49 family peptidase [Pseudomonas savastanoi]RML79973.1 putative phage-related protein [Pseudomonas savastanoi pv. savastanoi]RMT68862.1 putative phage-related protein [Pseudomonas savastanoi pv. nerii]RMT89823.1 putative phage-related protein [Pseudomonas savastanoi pv. nerii]TSC38517.1 S49 family peptidase [Pseudomonas sp. ST1]